MIIGIDTGGTFTDFVLLDKEMLRIHKVLSTPHNPEQAIVQGMTDLGLKDLALRLVHGSTVATNAVLERKGVRTVFITNRGFRDVLIIGRQARRELYNLTPDYIPPIVERSLCLEVDTRLNAKGKLEKNLEDQDLNRLIEEIRELEPQSVAISLLYSFLDGRQEQAIRKLISEELDDDLFVSLSSEILPEYREYERGMTTWLNAYVGPLVQGYLRRMEKELPAASISVMQSSGDTCNADQAGRKAVNLLLSGPAGGLEGARFVSETAGYKRLMTLDMGGTSTDVALINDVIMLTSEGKIGDLPVSVPMVDIHTIGAGGGSIAWVDEGGLLQVGPQSAGAAPGPVCYRQGGQKITVTDANLVLGRLPSFTRLGGEMQLDRDAAFKAMQRLAQASGLTTAEEVASGIVLIANEHMASALRVISVHKGYDPKAFVLVCFGGAGGLHICALAEALKMHSALVPIHAGVLSALGMLAARPGRQLSKTLAVALADQDAESLEQEFNALIEQGINALKAEGQEEQLFIISRSLDLCYQGQSFTLNVAWKQDIACVDRAFHEQHEKRYGHRLEGVPVELINVRVGISSRILPLSLPEWPQGEKASPVEEVHVHGISKPVSVWQRANLVIDQLIEGPAIITEAVSTTFVDPGWECRVDRYGNLHLRKT